MQYRIGVVGHPLNIDKIESVITQQFEDIEMYRIELYNYEGVKNTVQYLKAQADFFDGILFTGKHPYILMNHYMYPFNPWEYIKESHQQLHRILLESSFNPNYNIFNISIDSFDKADVEKSFSEIGLTENDYIAITESFDTLDDNFLNKVLNFHLDNYQNKHVSFCITTISSIYQSLTSMDIPCVLHHLTPESIKLALHNLKKKINNANIAESQIIVISIEIDKKSEYSLENENEYQIMLEKSKVNEEIYKFAQRIQAAVTENGDKNYLLFTTKKIIELETQNMKHLSLLTTVNDKTASTLSIGIGYGKTAREAKFNAILGKNRSIKKGGHNAYVVYTKSNIDIVNPKPIDQEYKTDIFDLSFKKIADETGISINTIYKLKCIQDQSDKEYFTTKELSDEYGNSHRSMNRIIEKLERAGYIDVAGKKIVEKAGRPSRIIKFIFEK